MSDYKPIYDHSFALIIGIDSYSDPRFPTLGNAASDAKSIADLLASPPFNFTVTTLFNEQATRQGILSALFSLRSTGPDDRIMVYFAGHGYTLVDKFNNETGYLATSDTVPEQDFTALELNEVTDLRLHAGAKHVAFVFDACFSGQALGLTRAASTASDKFLIRRAYQVISAGAGDQTVADARSMTTRVVEALKGAPTAAEGMVTFSALGAYVRDAISTDSGQTQLPQFGHLRGSQGGDFVLYMDAGPRLPADLMEALYSTIENIRLAGVVDLIDIAHGKDPALAEVARARLETIRKDDPSQEIRHAAASFFLRESKAGVKSGAQRKVTLVMQHKKPQELVNALDALLPDTADRAPVPEEVKQAQVGLDAAEAATGAAPKAESAAPGAKAAPVERRPRKGAAQAAPASAAPVRKRSAVPSTAALVKMLKKLPVWAWAAGGVVILAAVVGLATLGGKQAGPQQTAGVGATPSAAPSEPSSPTPTTAPTESPVATAAREPTEAATAVPVVGPEPTATPFGGGRGSILFAGERAGDVDIYAMSDFGGGVLNLTNSPGVREASPSWSPDGTQFAFASNRDANSDIFTISADGSDLVNLTNSRAEDTAPAWSHDGKRIAYVSDHDGNPDIFVMTTGDLNSTNLTSSSFQDDHPTWSPDDSRIAFVSLRGGNRDIFIMKSNGRGLINLTNNSSDDVDPAWSPDGNWIALSSFRMGNWEIFVSDLKGNAYQLTIDPGDDILPAWSPDSAHIVFVSNRSGDRQLWIVDLNGENLKQLTTDFTSAQGASWLN